MAFNHSYCMFCGQALLEGSEAKNSPRPLCTPCQQRDAQGQRFCPACRETIQVGATLCRFCGVALGPSSGGGVSTYAVMSLVAGIFGPFFCALPAILAVVFGFLALREIRASNGTLGGAGMAQWGRGLGIGWITLIALAVLLSLAAGFMSA